MPDGRVNEEFAKAIRETAARRLEPMGFSFASEEVRATFVITCFARGTVHVCFNADFRDGVMWAYVWAPHGRRRGGVTLGLADLLAARGIHGAESELVAPEARLTQEDAERYVVRACDYLKQHFQDVLDGGFSVYPAVRR